MKTSDIVPSGMSCLLWDNCTRNFQEAQFYLSTSLWADVDCVLICQEDHELTIVGVSSLL